jgi:hypothetical protein
MRIIGIRTTAVLLGTVAVLAVAWALLVTGPERVVVSVAASGPAPRPAGSTVPPPAAPLAATPSVATPGAAPRRAAPSGLPQAAATRPAPFVQTFAARPGAQPLRPLPSPTRTLRVPANVDGCDRNYGTRSQCIPWTFPAGITAKCDWLRVHGFTNPAVVGADRHRLDRDGNRIACD